MIGDDNDDHTVEAHDYHINDISVDMMIMIILG